MNKTHWRRAIGRAIGAAVLALGAGTTLAATEADQARYRGWIEQMKTAPRGPFDGIRWFCKDGRVLQPQDMSCAKHGTGWQHGEWRAQTRELRAQGYRVATLLARIDALNASNTGGFWHAKGDALPW